MNDRILKAIAYISMLIDHIGYVLFPDILVFRIIGRLAMPIFAFFIAEGIRYSKSYPKYLIRLFITALISEIPFRLCFEGTINGPFYPKNVLVTLFLGALALILTQIMIKKGLSKILCVIPCLCACILAILMETDWSYLGILMIFVFFFFKEKKANMVIGIVLIYIAAFMTDYLDTVMKLGLVSPFNFLIHLFGLVALVPIVYYNGEYTKSKLRYLMYLFYPLHLIVIYLISTLI